jgi:hypothetical protein
MTLQSRQLAMKKKQKPRRGWKLGRRRFKLTRLRWWMSIALQTNTPEAVARMIQDELKIEPSEVRRFVIERTKFLTPSES